MMNTSSNTSGNRVFPVNSLLYHDVSIPSMLLSNLSTARSEPPAPDTPRPTPGLSGAEVEVMLSAARAAAVAETEDRLQRQYEAKSAERMAAVQAAIELFRTERRQYFDRVESDVVHLALAIASKILHRESQVDPMLVAGLVRVAIDKLHDGSSVTVRVAPSEAPAWRAFLAHPANGAVIDVVEQESLAADACILETDLGSASFSVESQLQEIERGFFDLLAQRPAIR